MMWILKINFFLSIVSKTLYLFVSFFDLFPCLTAIQSIPIKARYNWILICSARSHLEISFLRFSNLFQFCSHFKTFPVWFHWLHGASRRDISGDICSWTTWSRFRTRKSAYCRRESRDVVRVAMARRNALSTLDTRMPCESDSSHDIWVDICTWRIYRTRCTDRSCRLTMKDENSWMHLYKNEWFFALLCIIWCCCSRIMVGNILRQTLHCCSAPGACSVLWYLSR